MFVYTSISPSRLADSPLLKKFPLYIPSSSLHLLSVTVCALPLSAAFLPSLLVSFLSPPFTWFSTFLLPTKPLLDRSCFVEMMRRQEEGSRITTEVIGSLRLSFVWRVLRFSLAEQPHYHNPATFCQPEKVCHYLHR